MIETLVLLGLIGLLAKNYLLRLTLAKVLTRQNCSIMLIFFKDTSATQVKEDVRRVMKIYANWVSIDLIFLSKLLSMSSVILCMLARVMKISVSFHIISRSY